MELLENERLEDLECNGLKIIQNKNLYTFTSDSVILANFLKIRQNQICVEIGSGSGVISLLACAKNPNLKKIYAFEVQEEISKLCQRNIELNSLEDKITLFNDKIQNYDKYLKKNSIDVVFTNPPYFRYIQSSSERDFGYENLSRYDKLLSIKDLVNSIKDLLKDKGKFYIIYDSERSTELIYELTLARLEPKTLFFTENGKGSVKLVVIEGVKIGKHGVKVLPNLITNDINGDYIEKLKTRNFK